MKSVRTISKRYYLRQIVACFLTLYMSLGIPAQVAMANPNPADGTLPGNVLSGSTIDPLTDIVTSGSTMGISSMAGAQTLINWDNFDIGYGATVNFNQDGGWVLNNVTPDGSGPSYATGIWGTLTAAQCGLIVKNQNGIVFGPKSLVSAKSFLAVGLKMNIDDFLAANFDPLNFEYGGLGEPGGDIELRGWNGRARIEVDDTVALIGHNIMNRGTITTQPGGRVLMAAGERVLLSTEGSKVIAEVSFDPVFNPEDFEIDNGGNWYYGGPRPGPGSIEAVGGQVVLAAGDIYSTAIEGVESLRATALGDATFYGPISAYAETASDAVAEVDIKTGGDLVVNYNITAEAVGVDNDTTPGDSTPDGDTYASIRLESTGGNLTIESDGSSGTEILATATDGVNNNADITLVAAGSVTVNGPDQVTVKAKADSDAFAGTENQANVNITGSSVLITGTDDGSTDEPATVKAYARDAATNRAKVDIQATGEEGDVEIIGAGSNGDSAIVMAYATNGSENYADVIINAPNGDVKIIAETGEYTNGTDTTKAMVIAKATDADVSNEANVEITAGGDVRVMSEGGQLNVLQEEYYELYWWNGSTWVKWYNSPSIPYGYFMYNPNRPYTYHPAETGFTPYVASVVAIAENGLSNTANVNINAGDDVKVIAKDGGITKVIASAECGDENISGVTINSNGDVKVLALDGTESTDGYTESEASIEAKAKNGLENTATIDITAVGGDVLVLGTEGGEAAVMALAKDASSPMTNTANVTITATEVEYLASGGDTETTDDDVYDTEGGDVKVIGVEGGEAEIEALAINGITNNAGVAITADGDVKVVAEKGGEAEIEAKAKNDGSLLDDYVSFDEVDELLVVDGFVNTATVDITAANVKVEAEKGGDAYIGAEASNEIEIDGIRPVFVVAADVEPLEPEVTEVTVRNVTNTATVDITATGTEYTQMELVSGGDTDTTDDDVYAEVTYLEGGDVKVIADKGGGAGIYAEAFNEIYDNECGGLVSVDVLPSSIDVIVEGPVANTAGVSIGAAGDVKVIAERGGDAGIYAEAWNDADVYYSDEAVVTNNADIAITAGFDVKVIGKDGGEAEIYAGAEEGTTNTANVTIDAGEDVLVLAKDGDNGKYGEASIEAEAENGNTNIAGIQIDAGDDVKVIAKDGGEASIEAEAEKGNSNTANVTLGGAGHRIGGDVIVKAEGYGSGPESEAAIKATAEKGSTNTADVLMCVAGDVEVTGGDCETSGGLASIEAEAEKGNTNSASVGIGAVGSVLVQGLNNGKARVYSEAEKGFENTASTIICTQEDLFVLAGNGGRAKVASEAMDGYHVDAYTGVHALGDVIVATASCEGESSARISSEAGSKGGEYDVLPSTAFADTVIVSDNGAIGVLAMGSGYAGITSYAHDAYNNDAYTGMCAAEDIVVAAAYGGTAMISSEAEGYPLERESQDKAELPEDATTANADTSVVSHGGIVAVLDVTNGIARSAGITSEAYNAELNTAYTGVAAGADLSPAAVFSDTPPETRLSSLLGEYGYGDYIVPGSVYVAAFGNGSDARIQSYAHDGLINTADTVVCAPGEVVVYNDSSGSVAKIKSWAKYGELNNTATTQVYASEVYVNVDSLYQGGGIGAWAQGDDWVHVDSDFSYVVGEDDPLFDQDGGSTLIINSYESRQDCPTCPPVPECPGCEEEEDIPNPTPPLYTEAGEPLEKVGFGEGGCPALMNWFASEAGIPADQISVLLGGADYLATNIQPCEACARLKAQADAMGGLGAEQVNAWATTVRAALVGPPTPEMIAGIRTALADNPDAISFDDAATEYVRILNEELGIPAEDALAMLTGNYAPDSADLGAYVGARSGI